MSTTLHEWLDKTVTVITSDGRNIVGTLKGFDQLQNLVLTDSHERVFSEGRKLSKKSYSP
jgi:U6 snRNA-associated Sm-like protein LSm8